jgi:hypothetical protein
MLSGVSFSFHIKQQHVQSILLDHGCGRRRSLGLPAAWFRTFSIESFNLTVSRCERLCNELLELSRRMTLLSVKVRRSEPEDWFQ